MVATAYSEEEIARISKEVFTDIMGGATLFAACNKPGRVSHVTFFKWLHLFPELANQYTQATAVRAELQAEEILEIADESSADFIIDENGKRTADPEAIARSRLRIDARKWLMAKMLPKKYGDKLEVNDIVQTAVEARESPLQPAEFAQIAKKLLSEV